MGFSKEATDRGSDLIAHKGFDRVFERRMQLEYPDYFLQQLQGHTSRHSPHAQTLTEKKTQPSLKMKVSSKFLLIFELNSRLYQEDVG